MLSPSGLDNPGTRDIFYLRDSSSNHSHSMCGIVGYVGKQKAVPLIIEGLKRLEYRGYDSAGVAVLQNGSFEVAKKIGRVTNLEQEAAKHRFTGMYGMGHTRW